MQATAAAATTGCRRATEGDKCLQVFFGDVRTYGATMSSQIEKRGVSQVEFYVCGRAPSREESEQGTGVNESTRSHLLTCGKVIERHETGPLMSDAFGRRRDEKRVRAGPETCGV